MVMIVVVVVVVDAVNVTYDGVDTLALPPLHLLLAVLFLVLGEEQLGQVWRTDRQAASFGPLEVQHVN